jgi:hypothetical protein
LLKASLQSKMVLTSVFLKKKYWYRQGVTRRSFIYESSLFWKLRCYESSCWEHGILVSFVSSLLLVVLLKNLLARLSILFWMIKSMNELYCTNAFVFDPYIGFKSLMWKLICSIPNTGMRLIMGIKLCPSIPIKSHSNIEKNLMLH